MVQISDEGIIFCGESQEMMIVCDFFNTYAIDQECGNCPLTRFVEKCLDKELNVSLGDFLCLFG